MADTGRLGVSDLLRRVDQLNAIGISLSAESDPARLLERILGGAKELTRADGGTVYAVTPQQQLRFEILRNDSLGLAMGGPGGQQIPYPPVPLSLPDGQPNHASVVAHCVLSGTTINIPNAYDAKGFDFAGTRAFDARTGYRSKSILTVPMRNHEGEITGVLQLINARDMHGKVLGFSAMDQRMIESLASQAAIGITKHELTEGMRRLFESFVELIAAAIDEKSPYTGGHCRRVPELTMALAEAAARTTDGPLADFTMSEADRYELKIAAWIHDCGKISSPESVMDKATKLAAVYDRIGLVETRWEVIRRDLEIAHLRALSAASAERRVVAEREYAAALAALEDDLTFLRRCNIGGEAMSAADQERVRAIGARSWRNSDGELLPLLSENEVRNLTIAKGTLLPEARDHQQPYRRHHQHARGAALSQAPAARPGVRRRPPRAHGWQGLPQGPHARADVGAGAHHGHRRHLRGPHGRRSAVHAGDEALDRPHHPWSHGPRWPHRSRPVPGVHPRGGVPRLCRTLPDPGAN